ncbi:YbjQ family protein [bacterium]|nr:YbjQ family protein [bacterium]QQR60279.1 MAG: YbjQ family protein [Candidatus Melainabacteria bacterium]
MIVITTSSIDGYHVKEYRGIVRGVTVRQPTIGQSFTAGFQKLAGGKINSYVAMAEKARQTAYALAVSKARELGANALIGVKYDSTSCDNGGQPVTEVLCYGTAVVVEKDSK